MGQGTLAPRRRQLDLLQVLAMFIDLLTRNNKWVIVELSFDPE